ncbi:hypothetical protein NDU88_004114 [Pleurodeles waltl]|uniref:Uncharacterized protein n=1 Tax=Pleurodeles waltl TaxID=8319 RepID=A0AAV7L0Z0_PLEWA|nr:hypothetical protein NDU88_004114 [Pleurodeles waltl]
MDTAQTIAETPTIDPPHPRGGDNIMVCYVDSAFAKALRHTYGQTYDSIFDIAPLCKYWAIKTSINRVPVSSEGNGGLKLRQSARAAGTSVLRPCSRAWNPTVDPNLAPVNPGADRAADRILVDPSASCRPGRLQAQHASLGAQLPLCAASKERSSV